MSFNDEQMRELYGSDEVFAAIINEMMHGVFIRKYTIIELRQMVLFACDRAERLKAQRARAKMDNENHN